MTVPVLLRSAPTDWDTLRTVAGWLRPCFAPSPPELLAGPQPWEALIGTASRHMVAPALGWAWAGRADLPPEVSQLFGGLLAMNRARNASLMADIEALLVALNREGIVPMLLKGSAMLADGTYPDPGMRMIGDCDMLIPEPALQRAAQVLEAAGYVPWDATKPVLRGHHHLPVRRNPDSLLAVELHRSPVNRRWRGIVDARSFFERGRAIEVGEGRALIPHIDDRVAHTVVHTQLADNLYRKGYPHLRQLLDIATFRQRHDSTIDWQAISDRFRRARQLHVLSDNLALVEALLGQPAPASAPGDSERAARRVQRALARTPAIRFVRGVQWTLAYAVRSLVADPRYLGAWIANARERRSVLGGIRRRARAG